MLLHIIARGKIGRSPEAELVDRYLKRIAWPTKVSELPDRGGTVPAAPSSSVRCSSANGPPGPMPNSLANALRTTS